MKDQFANYVVQKVLETCDDQQRELILSRIKVHLSALKKYTYGKHIVARVEKLVAAGGIHSFFLCYIYEFVLLCMHVCRFRYFYMYLCWLACMYIQVHVRISIIFPTPSKQTVTSVFFSYLADLTF